MSAHREHVSQILVPPQKLPGKIWSDQNSFLVDCAHNLTEQDFILLIQGLLQTEQIPAARDYLRQLKSQNPAHRDTSGQSKSLIPAAREEKYFSDNSSLRFPRTATHPDNPSRLFSRGPRRKIFFRQLKSRIPAHRDTSGQSKSLIFPRPAKKNIFRHGTQQQE